jgi:hypothetical protein
LFSPGTPISSSNKTDRHDIPEILFTVVLNTINQPLTHKKYEVRINLCVQASGQRIHPEVQHPSLRSELSVKSIS